MGNQNWVAGKQGETSTGPQAVGQSTVFADLKQSIAEKLHKVAEALDDRASAHEAQSGTAQYEKQASEWLDHAAEYLRAFRYEQADARVREYVRQSPGRSLLIAGAVGLMIGALLRRR